MHMVARSSRPKLAVCARNARKEASPLPVESKLEFERWLQCWESMDLSDVELAEQSAKLEALAEMWKKREDVGEYEEGLRSGWGPSPERINGRAAMFFIVTGLITEYYTGQSLPQQVYTMLQTLSIIE